MSYPVKDVYVTMPFGRPGNVWAAGKHTGTDFRAAVGTSVYATRGGTVEHVGWGGYGQAYGFHVIIRCRTKLGATRKVLYAHLSGASVHAGEVVSMGERIGASGETGNTFGPHLHYEERTSPYGYYNYAAPVFLSYKKKEPKPKVSVKLHKLKPGKTAGSVGIVRRRLRRKGIKAGYGFKFDQKFRDAYQRWQHRLGYKGADANGIPGRTSLQKLNLRVKK